MYSTSIYPISRTTFLVFFSFFLMLSFFLLDFKIQSLLVIRPLLNILVSDIISTSRNKILTNHFKCQTLVRHLLEA